MRILIAPDSFKDALCASDVAEAIAEGVRRALPMANLDLCPLGDGGEGTLAALLAAAPASSPIEARELEVHDPLGRPIRARWGWQPDQRTAIVELAEASGLQCLAAEERDARVTSTYGTGELIRAALDAGAQRLLLTLGGSATNDAGAGMLCALGARLLDDQGNPLPPGGAALAKLARLDLTRLDPRLTQLRVEAAVDVDNPLYGPRGASAVFGPQKGAGVDEVVELDRALAHYADICRAELAGDWDQLPGAGAAGGMGYAAAAWLGATLRPGIELVMERLEMSARIAGCDLLITGEGSLDGQSLSGKTPIGAARAARSAGVPTIVLAGRLGDGWRAAYEEGITAILPLADGALALPDSLRRTPELLADRSEAIIRLWQAAAR